jgi:hypothetical protein
MHVNRLKSMKKIQKHEDVGRDKFITLVEKGENPDNDE